MGEQDQEAKPPFEDSNGEIRQQDWQVFMEDMSGQKVDLILTDPPYTISRETGFKKVKNGVDRFAVSMDFGAWDHEQIDLVRFCSACYGALRQGGTAIIWYDLWKLTELEQAMKQAKFKMIRLIVWQKTNPVPLNQSATYLSNSREIAVVGVKGGKPTFNDKYDNGVYEAPIPRHGGRRIHPTQKPEGLFADLVAKHSNEGDLVVDPFFGSGTTAAAALKEGRRFLGCEINPKYVAHARERAMNTQLSKRALFLELAQPDEDGFSRAVSVDEFVGKYEGLRLGNGGSWCRAEGGLAKTYNIRRTKQGNRITEISLQGLNKNPIDKFIPARISKVIKKERCPVLGTSRVEVDHKDGRRDDPRLMDASKVTLDDFQPLSKAANNAKRQHCKECRETDKRFDAKRLGYPVSQIPGKGDGTYGGSCVGCYWHDILAFRKAIGGK